MTKNIPVLRASEGSYVDGIYTAGERVQLTVKGTIQPDKKDRKSIAENNNPDLLGKDIDGCVIIYCTSPLFTIQKDGLKKADIVIYDNKMYQVVSSSSLRQLISLKHYKYNAEYLEVLDDGNGTEPVEGDPFKPGTVQVSKNGILQGEQKELNFIAGEGVNLDITNDTINHRIDITLSGDGSSGQQLTEIVVSENIPELSLVTTQGLKADSGNISQRDKIIGINKDPILSDNSGFVYFSGELFSTSLNFPIGSELFLNGSTLSTLIPSTGYIQSVGIITKTNTLLIDISEAILL